MDLKPSLIDSDAQEQGNEGQAGNVQADRLSARGAFKGTCNSQNTSNSSLMKLVRLIRRGRPAWRNLGHKSNRLKIPAMLKQMPRNGGTTLRMRRYNPLATAPVPLGNSGITPPPQQLTAVDIDAKMDFYGWALREAA